MGRNLLIVVAVLVLLAGAFAIASSPRTATPVRAPEPVVVGPAIVAPAMSPLSVAGVKARRADENSGNDGNLVVMGDVSPYYHTGDKVVVVRPDGKLHRAKVLACVVMPATEGNQSGYTKVYLDQPYHDPRVAPSMLLLPAAK